MTRTSLAKLETVLVAALAKLELKPFEFQSTLGIPRTGYGGTQINSAMPKCSTEDRRTYLAFWGALAWRICDYYTIRVVLWP